MMDINTITRYELDPSGLNPANRITERITLHAAQNKDLHFYIPRYAPFFRKNVIITKFIPGQITPEPLVIDEDYTIVGPLGHIDNLSHGNDYVGTVILFDDLLMDGEYTITYQTLGGDYYIDEDGYARAIIKYLKNPLNVTWEEIIGRPLVLPTLEHNHRPDDLVSITTWLDKINEIATFCREFVDNELATVGNSEENSTEEEGSFARLNQLLANYETNLNNLKTQTQALVTESRELKETIQEKFNELSRNVGQEISETRQQALESLTQKKESLKFDLLQLLNRKQTELLNSLNTRTEEVLTSIQNTISSIPQDVSERLTQIEANFQNVDLSQYYNKNEINAHFSGISNRLNKILEDIRLLASAKANNTDVDKHIATLKEEKDTEIAGLNNEITTIKSRLNESPEIDTTSLKQEIFTETDKSYVKKTEIATGYVPLDTYRALHDRVNTMEGNITTLQNTSDISDLYINKEEDNQYKGYIEGRGELQYKGLRFKNDTVFEEMVAGTVKSIQVKNGNLGAQDLYWAKPTTTTSLERTLFNGSSRTVPPAVKGFYEDYLKVLLGQNYFKAIKLEESNNRTGYTGNLTNEQGVLKWDSPSNAGILAKDFSIVNGNSYYSIKDKLNTIPSPQEISTLKTNVSNLTTRLNEGEREIQTLNNGMNQVSTQLAGLNNTIEAEVNRVFNPMNTRVTTLENSKTTIERNINNLTSRLATVERSSGQANINVQRNNDWNAYNTTIGKIPTIRADGEITVGQKLNMRRNGSNLQATFDYNEDVDNFPVVMLNGIIKARAVGVASDRRLKEEIYPILDPLALLEGIETQSFKLKGSNKRTVGLIAQDVEDNIPEAVFTDHKGMLVIQYDSLIALLVGAVNQQQEKIEQLEKRLSALEKE